MCRRRGIRKLAGCHSHCPRRPSRCSLSPLHGPLTASPTPAEPIHDRGTHYCTYHDATDESPDVHRTSPPNTSLRRQHREYLITLGPGQSQKTAVRVFAC
jgi:hypothetical protein